MTRHTSPGRTAGDRSSPRRCALRAALLTCTALSLHTPALAGERLGDRFDDTFTAATYNVHGQPKEVKARVFGSFDITQRINTDAKIEEHVAAISPLLNRFDIVNIQEDNVTNRGVIRLQDPNFGTVEIKPFVAYHDEIYASADHAYKSKAAPNSHTGLLGTDGLNTLSRFRWDGAQAGEQADIKRVLFSRCGSGLPAIECAVGKGLSVTRMRMEDGSILDVYNAHGVAGTSDEESETRRRNLTELGDYIKQNSEGHAVLLMMDSNSRYSAGRENAELNALMDKTGMVDAWVDTARGGQQPSPDLSAENQDLVRRVYRNADSAGDALATRIPTRRRPKSSTRSSIAAPTISTWTRSATSSTIRPSTTRKASRSPITGPSSPSSRSGRAA